MLMIIPFILLLVIAIVLQKRNANKPESKNDKKAVPNKAEPTKAAKKSKDKKAQKNAPVTEQLVADEHGRTPLQPEIRQNIESLIGQKNYFAAEANINQALNKDNSRHELYLLLMHIHLLQKDEFAVNQLLNHLRNLNLDDILEDAETQKIAFEQQQNQVNDSIEFSTPEPEQITATQQTADFDSLIEQQNTNSSFDQLHDAAANKQNAPLEFSLNPEKAKPEVNFEQLHAQPVTEVKVAPPVLEFDLSETKPTTPTPAAPPVLEFDFADTAAKPTPVVEEAKVDAPSMDFDLNFEPQAKPTPVVEEAKIDAPSMDFDLNFAPQAKPTPVVEEAKVDAPSMDFDLDFAKAKPTPVVEQAKIDAPSMDFDLNFAPQAKPAPVVEEAKIDAPSMDFDLDFAKAKPTPVVEEVKVDAPSMDFDLNFAPQAKPAPVVEEAKIDAPSMDFDLDFAKAKPAPVVEEAKVDAPSMDFDLNFAPQAKPAPVVEEAKVDAPSMDFDLDFAPQAKSTPVVEEARVDAPSMDFDLNFAPQAKQTPVVEEAKVDAPIVDFDLDFAKAKQAPAEDTQIDAPSVNFNLEFAKAKQAPAVEDTQEVNLDFAPNIATTQKFDFNTDSTELEFTSQSTEKFSQVTPTNPTETPSLDFSFSLDQDLTALNTPVIAPTPVALPVSVPVATPVVEAPAVTETTLSDFNLDFSLDGVPDAAPILTPAAVELTPEDHSPAPVSFSQSLVQAYPELTELDEAQLNVELAEQYIILGAYDAARELLAEKQAEYSEQQQQKITALINQIAS